MDQPKPSSVAAACVAAIIVVGVTVVAQVGGRGRGSAAGITPHDGRIYLASGSQTRGATEVDTQEIYVPVRP